MRKLISHTILTLDGVATFDAVADTIIELRGGEAGEDFFRRVADEDAMVLGRTTYEEWAEYWPTSTNEPFASHINGVPKFVVSRSLDAVPWGQHGSATLLDGDLADAITDLKQQPGGTIGVHGSLTPVEGLLQANLLDEMRLEIYPVIGGKGDRLFHDQPAPKRLRLACSLIASNGVAVLTYERAT
jgi:dihydrofolate reductase